MIARAAIFALLLLATVSCGPATPPAPARTRLTIHADPALEPVARALESSYEADHPDVDVILVGDDADVRLVEAPAQLEDAVLIRRQVGILVGARSRLRLIDLSTGTCDIVIGPANTPLGELGRETLAARGLDDTINPRLLEADPDHFVVQVVDRDAIGVGYVTLAIDRPVELRILADGASSDSAIIPTTPSGRALTDWLTRALTPTRPLHELGFQLADEPLRITPEGP